MHIHKPAQMASECTSIKIIKHTKESIKDSKVSSPDPSTKVSYSSLASGMEVCSVKKRKEEDVSVVVQDVESDDEFAKEIIDASYEIQYNKLSNLYDTLKRISQEAIYPLFDNLNFSLLLKLFGMDPEFEEELV